MINGEEKSDDLPPLYDIFLDFDLICGEYEKYFADFLDDFFNICSRIFFARICSLQGQFSEVISLRSRLLKGEKMEKIEKRAARKVLNEDQKEYYENKIEESKFKQGQIIHEEMGNNIEKVLRQNREKNLRRGR